MAVFKQKKFSKTKTIKTVGKYIKDHPILPVSTASLGVGLANYATNTKRRKESIEQHKEQIKAFKELNNNITKNSEALREVNSALKDNTIKLRKDFNINQRRKRSFLIFKKKDFSIQDGGFRGNKISPKKDSIGVGAGIGAVVGAGFGLVSAKSNPMAKNTTVIAIGSILGAGVGALATWLNNVARESIFNLGLSTKANSYTLIKQLESYYLPEEETVEKSTTTTSVNNNITKTNTIKTSSVKSSVSPVGTLFSVDNDPKKHVVNVLLRGNVMSILINKPNSIELKLLNRILDNYCSKYKLADYSATKLESNIYLVEVNIVSNTEASLVNKMIDVELKVNILTTDRFGIKNT